MAVRDRGDAASAYSVASADVVRAPGGVFETDRIAVEEPLEIRVRGVPVAVTMRRQGHDEELAVGFCLSEGMRARGAHPPADLAANRVEVDADDFDVDSIRRNFYTSSSCGVCGKGALEAVAVDAPRVEGSLRIPYTLVEELPERLRSAQRAFAVTGGLHATGLFDRTGELRCAREDVGRHNAMDKVIGWAHENGALPLSTNMLCVSGRLSFELVQKSSVAVCPLLAAAAPPSSLAVGLGRDRGITLCGFLRS